MPLNYASVVSNFSGSRLDTYKLRLNCGDEAQTVEMFFLFQDICSHLFTPLQMLEVTLRNGIHAAARAKRRQIDWYAHIALTPESQRHLAAAQTSATRDLQNIRIPTTDDIICRLPFGFWVYMLSQTYRDTKPATNLWNQFNQKTLFPHAHGMTMKAIFSRLEIVNNLRNRLFHHEPIWSGYGVSDIDQALKKIKEKHQLVTETLGWISAEQRDLLSAWGFEGRFNLACDASRFNRRMW
ncbi:hypothetical protein [Massilia sp. TWP1-3-3]|uniref:hypothetical protein n=1 Tax=Massilia sp. TWP1-3-3 TaxID=2804573 RepID=UPI003CEF588C